MIFIESMFEHRKYLKELFNNFPISDIADEWGNVFLCDFGAKMG